MKGQILTEQSYNVRRIHFEGNSAYSESRLKKVIRLKEKGVFKFRSEFNRRALKLDAITLRTFYESQGFLNTQVSDSFKVIKSRNVDVFFSIEEGARSYLKNVEIGGNHSVSREEIIKILQLHAEKPFNPVAVRQGIPVLERKYHGKGKLLVLFRDSFTPGTNIDYTLHIEEGPDVKIGRTIMNGLKSIDSSLVLRELQMAKGELYNVEKVDLTQRRIFETGLFSMVNLFPVGNSRGNEWVNLVVEVKELKPREWILDGGIYPIRLFEGVETVSGPGNSVEWRHRSIFGTGVRFGANSTLELPIGDFRKIPDIFPWIWKFGTSVSSNWVGSLRFPTYLRLFYDGIENPYQQIGRLWRYGVEWNYLHKFQENSELRGGLSWSKVLTKGDKNQGALRMREEEQERRLNLSYRSRRLDNFIMPKSGRQFSLDASLIGTFLGGTRDYFRIETDYRRFYLIPFSWVFAFRHKVGWIEPLNVSASSEESLNQIPEYDHFYLGGNTSLRAWESQMFWTNASRDKPAGGLIKLLINLELRVPVWKNLGFNVFLDGGLLSENSSQLKEQINEWLGGTGWDYGLELTYASALGPVRVYYSIPIIKEVPPMINLALLYAF